jgi:heme/copper-type cytochrome/quinol oxidase subunit 2
MLTPEEEKFVQYWQEQRQHKKEFLRKFSIGLPAVSLIAILFFINFLSGWYAKADQELREHSSLVIVILVAVIAIVVFMVIFSARYKWEQNEADYQMLLKKKETQSGNEMFNQTM